MIQFAHVTKKIDNKYTVLEDISFFIHRGEFVFLTGPSGAGKTTAMRHIYMEDFPTRGEVIVCGIHSDDVKRKPADKLPQLRRYLGIVFQDFKLLFDRTAFENVAIALRVTGQSKKIIKQKVLQVLSEVGLCHRLKDYPARLSWGEQQRLAIARAIANDPYVLLADEPTGNLDIKTGIEIVDLLQRVNANGTAVIMATHDIHLIENMPYRNLRLEHGRLVSREN